MAISSNTEYSATIDEKWDSDVERARYSKSKLMPAVMNKSALIKGSGDIINITVEPRLSVGDINASTGAFTQRSATLTNVQVLINQSKEVNVNTTDQALAQSFWGIESVFPDSAGKALAEEYDRFISVTGYQGALAANTIGSEAAPVPLTNNNVRAALLRLADNRVPVENEDLTLATPPSGLYVDLLGETEYTASYAIGGNVKSPLITGNVNFQVLGCKVAATAEIALVNGSVYKAMLFHKSAIAFGMQKGHEFERYSLASAGVAGKGVLMISLYGAKVARSDHISVINTAKA